MYDKIIFIEKSRIVNINVASSHDKFCNIFNIL